MSDKKNTEEKPAEIAIIDERTIRDKIYEVRGVKVMLDFDLAEIYGFSTSAFNQQVKRNAERFDDDFRFQLTREEVERISISQIVTSIQTKGVKGGRSKLPYLIREGMPVKADVTYMDIYSKASKSVYLIDNYINIKTLRLLQSVKPGVTVTVFSDNLRNHLHASDYTDFQVEFPDIPVTFITTGGIMHDRFIVLDYDEADERMFHCGASSKDAGIRLTTAITELTSGDVKTKMHELIEQIKGNPVLNLR